MFIWRLLSKFIILQQTKLSPTPKPVTKPVPPSQRPIRPLIDHNKNLYWCCCWLKVFFWGFDISFYISRLNFWITQNMSTPYIILLSYCAYIITKHIFILHLIIFSAKNWFQPKQPILFWHSTYLYLETRHCMCCHKWRWR